MMNYSQSISQDRLELIEESVLRQLIPSPFLKSIATKMIAFVLSMLAGHFINPKLLTKQDEKRIE